MLEIVKTALRVKTDAYDQELSMIINACLIDLGLAGVVEDKLGLDNNDDLIILAVTLYCKRNFSRTAPSEFEALDGAYEIIKTRLHSATGYTDWSD